MAYIVVSFKGEEAGRWPLEAETVIGRSPACDICVRDILLSRKHCQIVPYRAGWIAVDLQSKNGTRCGVELIERRGLADGDVLSMGKCQVRFCVGQLKPSEIRVPRRPKDPFEALANTVSEFNPKQVEAYRNANRMPSPKPIPRDPDSYVSEDVYSLISGIASSSWDSIYAQASRPRRPIPRIHALLAPADKAAVERVMLGGAKPDLRLRPSARPERSPTPERSRTVDLEMTVGHAGWFRRMASKLLKPILGHAR